MPRAAAAHRVHDDGVDVPVRRRHEDQLMDTALEAGMEDMKTYDDCFEIITTPEDFDIVKGSIVSAGYDIIEGDIEYVPSVEANPTDESDIKNLKKMLEIHGWIC